MIRAPQRVARGQGGWVGLIVVLVALAIVAFLAKDALKRYGLAPRAGEAPAARAGGAGERARAPGAVGVDPGDLGTVPAAPASAIERARGVEDAVKRQADERARRVDGAPR